MILAPPKDKSSFIIAKTPAIKLFTLKIRFSALRNIGLSILSFLSRVGLER